MAFHLAHSVLSGVYFPVVRIELQVPANVQRLYNRGYSRVGCCEGNLSGGKTNFKLSSLGKKWLRSGSKKTELNEKNK
jgi:hypothetical protein